MIVIAEPKSVWRIVVYVFELQSDDVPSLWEAVELIRMAHDEDYDIRVVDDWDGKLRNKSIWPFRRVRTLLLVRSSE